MLARRLGSHRQRTSSWREFSLVAYEHALMDFPVFLLLNGPLVALNLRCTLAGLAVDLVEVVAELVEAP